MSRYLKTSDGRFAGSIGDGRDRLPSPTHVTVPDTALEVAPLVDLAAVRAAVAPVEEPYADFTARVHAARVKVTKTSLGCLYAGCAVRPRNGYYCSRNHHDDPVTGEGAAIALSWTVDEWAEAFGDGRRWSRRTEEAVGVYFAMRYRAANRTHVLTRADLDRLFADPNLAAMRLTSYEVLVPMEYKRIAVRGDLQMREALARSMTLYGLPEDMQMVLARDEHWWVRHALATRDGVCDAARVLLRADSEPEVRQAMQDTDERYPHGKAPLHRPLEAHINIGAAPKWSATGQQVRGYLRFHTSTDAVYDTAVRLLEDRWDGGVVDLLATAEALAR